MFKNRRATKRLIIEVNTLAKAQVALLDAISDAVRKAPHDMYGNLTAGIKTTHEIDGMKKALEVIQSIELTK